CGENRFAWVVMLPAVATARAVTEEAAVTAWKKPAPLSSARAKQRAWNRTRSMYTSAQGRCEMAQAPPAGPRHKPLDLQEFRLRGWGRLLYRPRPAACGSVRHAAGSPAGAPDRGRPRGGVADNVGRGGPFGRATRPLRIGSSPENLHAGHYLARWQRAQLRSPGHGGRGGGRHWTGLAQGGARRARQRQTGRYLARH